MNAPQSIDGRAARMAAILLDTRVNGRYVPRDVWRGTPLPTALTARRSAARLAEAVGCAITGDDVIAGHKLLRTRTPTHVIRAAADDTGVSR